MRYAAVTNDDYEEFKKAVKAGRMKVAGEKKKRILRNEAGLKG
jgi:hypothetical protein